MKEREWEERGWRRVEEIHHARENLFYDRVHPYRTQLLFVYRAEWVGLLEGGASRGCGPSHRFELLYHQTFIQEEIGTC